MISQVITLKHISTRVPLIDCNKLIELFQLLKYRGDLFRLETPWLYYQNRARASCGLSINSSDASDARLDLALHKNEDRMIVGRPMVIQLNSAAVIAEGYHFVWAPDFRLLAI